MFRSKHFNAILTKFLLVVTVMGMLLPPIAKISMVTAVVTALCLSFAAYIVADLLILSWYGNRIAVLTDVMMTIGLTYEIVMYMERQAVPLVGLLFIGLLIGCGEWFYHQRYLSRLLYGGKIRP